MKRRAVLKLLGVGGLASLGGCLATEPPAKPYPDLPAMFTNPRYAARFRSHAPWAHADFDPGRTGGNTDSRLPGDTLDAAWLRYLDDTVSRRTAPVTDDQRVFIGHANHDRGQLVVTALNGRSGDQVWRRVLNPRDSNESADEEDPEAVAHVDGTVFYVGGVGFSKTRLAAVAADTGEVEWQTTVPGEPLSEPTIDSDVIVLPLGKNGEAPRSVVTGYTHDGAEQWTVPFDDSHTDSPVCIDSSVVYVGVIDGTVVALDAGSGDILWERRVVSESQCPGASDVSIQEGPVVDEERLYVVSADTTLYAVDRDDGKPVWTRSLTDECTAGRSAPVLGDGRLYVWAGRRGLRALDPTDGTLLWNREDIRGNTDVAAGDGGVVAAGETTVTTLTSTGETAGAVDFPRRVIQSDGDEKRERTITPRLAVAHNLVYVGLSDGRAYALGEKTEDTETEVA